MALTQLTDDLNYIQQLGDNPNTDNGLTPAELKAWFDKAPNAIKKYLNSTLIQELDAKFTTMDKNEKLTNEEITQLKNRLQNIIIGTGFVSTDGTVAMAADLPMGGNRVVGLGEPLEDTDGVTLGYAKKVGAPRNLLDNTDFGIAQAGYGGYHGTEIYAADRWVQNDTTERTYTKVMHNGHGAIKCSAETRIQQYVDLPEGIDYTAAVIVDDVQYVITFTADGSGGGGGKLWVNHSDRGYYFTITDIPANAVVSEPMLLKGTYTAETLPEYQYKGYAAELAECRRYFRNMKQSIAPCVSHSANALAVYVDMTGMRTNPTVTEFSIAWLDYNGQRLTSGFDSAAYSLPTRINVTTTSESVLEINHAGMVYFSALMLSADL